MIKHRRHGFLAKRWQFAFVLLFVGLALALSPPASAAPAGSPEAPSLRLMSPTAHGGGVSALAATQNAELVATGGGDQRIHLWHIPTARQWRSLAGHTAGVRALAFSPDGSLLASGDEDGGVRVWRVADGANLCSWKNVDDRDPQLPADQSTMRVGWDGRDAVWAVGQRGLARQWKLAGCAESARTAVHDSTTWDALRERDGWVIATQEAVLRLDARGKSLWKIPLEAAPESLYRRKAGYAVLLDDGRVLEFDGGGRAVSTPPVQLPRSSGISLTPLGDGWIATSGSRVLTHYRGATSQDIAPLDTVERGTAHNLYSLDRVAVIGQKIIAASSRGLIVLDASSFKEMAYLDVPAAVYTSVIAVNAVSNRLLVGGISGLVLWDLSAGRPIGSLKLPQEHADIVAARFSADGSKLLILARSNERGTNRMLFSYNFDSGLFLPPVILPGSVFEIAVAPSGSRVFVATSTGVFAYRALDLAPLGKIGGIAYSEHVDVDASGTRMLAANANAAELIDLGNGQVLNRWDAGSDTDRLLGGAIRDVRLGQAGETIWFATATGVTALDAKGARRWRTELPVDFRRRLDLAPDGRTLLAAGVVAARLDAQTGVASPLALPVAGESIAWLDARNALMLGVDGAVRLWQSEPRPLLEWRTFDRANLSACGYRAGLCGDPLPWIVASETGRFDLGDFGDLPQLAWYDSREPNRPLQIEWFARTAFSPRLLARTLAQGLPPGGRLSPKPVNPPRVKILSLAAAAPPVNGVQIEVAVEQGGQPLAGVQLYRNGVRVAQADARSIAAAPRRDGARVVRFDAVRLPNTLSSESIRFEAWAFDSDGIRSSAAYAQHTPKYDPTRQWRPNRSWLLTIGVNRHENASFDLAYAANDAVRIGAVLAKTLAVEGSNGVITVPLIADQSPVAASKARIREALQILAGSAPTSTDPALAPLARADPGDRVVISFAGHGVRDSAGEFYLVPGDTGPGEGRIADASLFAHSISSRELAQWLDGLDAGRVVLILDACHAAAAVDSNDFVPGPMDSAGLGQLAYDKGFAVLVATQADDVALESGSLKQGVLTYSLIREGLEARAADYSPVDGRIGVIEWLRYGVSAVPGLARRVRSGDLPTAPDSRGLSLTRQTSKAPVAQTPTLFYFPRGRLDEQLLAVPR